MINGLFIGSDGSVQVIGNVPSFSAILESMAKVKPELEAAELKRIEETVPADVLEKILAMQKDKKEKEAVDLAKLEP